MIFGFELSLFLLVPLAALFRLLWNVSQKSAYVLLISISLFLLFSANMMLFAYLVAQIVWVAILYTFAKNRPAKARFIAWFAFLGVIPFNIQIWARGSLDPEQVFAPFGYVGISGVFWTVGSAFFVIKSFMVLRESLQQGKISVLPALANLTFLPSFPAGPITGMAPFKSENIETVLDLKKLAIAFMQLGWGTASLYVFAPAIKTYAAEFSGGAFNEAAKIYLNFAALYFDFAGYSLMAIAIARFYGVTLPQNFNRPYLATNIQEFWQRWHMSLSAFIGMYLFKPFVRKTGSPQKGIFLAFICAGLWHEIMPGYLLWGIGHGAALSIAMKPPKFWTSRVSKLPDWGRKLLGWFLTMSWVALMSTMANAEFFH